MSNVTYCSILYCAPMWFDCTKTALTKLKVAIYELAMAQQIQIQIIYST